MKKILILLVIICALKSNAQNYPYRVINASESYNGVFGQAYITFKYINPANQVLQRPLIVAEGYDSGEILSPEEPFGETDIFNGFLNEAEVPNISGQLASLIDGDPLDYDVVYVDWKNGTDYMERNALVLEEVIRWVNNNKVAVNGVIQPNVLLGFSMGGVLGRYALKDMEDKSEDHQTRLFISWDAPHQGAVVPKGFAHLARHARDLYIQTGPIGATVDVIRFMRGEMVPGHAVNLADRPASRQLLMNYVNPFNEVDNSMFNSWQTTLRNKGYPSGGVVPNFSMIAVSNGSECAKMQVVPPGGNLLTYQGKGNTKLAADLGFASRIALSTTGTLLNQPSLIILGTIPGRNDFNLDFVVNSQADGAANQVYKGKITYTKKILWFIPVTKVITDKNFSGNASTLSYESYAGGFINMEANGPALNDQSVNSIFYRYNITASLAPSFGFIPVPSALDIGGGNVTLNKTDYLTPYRGSNPPVGIRASSFPNFITAFIGNADNEQHMQIETRNGNWVASRMQNVNTLPTNCLFACPGFTLTPTQMCNNTTLNVSLSLPQGATATWNAPSWVTVTPQNTEGSIVTVSSNSSSGLANLGVSINPGTSGCGTGTVLLSQLVKVGAPNYYTLTAPYTTEGYSDYLHQDGEDTNCLKTYTFPGMYSGNIDLSDVVADSYTWTFVSKSPSSATVSIGSLTTPQHVTVTVKPQYAQVTYQLTTSNSCGSYSANYTFRADGFCVGTVERSSGISSISVSPNPVTGRCSVVLTPGNSNASIRQIQVLDKFGATLKQYKYKAGELKQIIGMESLKPDIYVLQVFDGTTWISTKVAKE